MSGRIPIDEFIKHHSNNFVNYCEIVIHSNGDCEYCIPSHQKKLIELTGLKEDVVWDIISPMDDVMKTLCNMTNCVSVWYEYQIYPDTMSKKQRKALIKLKENKCIIYNGR